MKNFIMLLFATILYTNFVFADDGTQKTESATESPGQRVKTPKKTAEQKASSLTDAMHEAVSLSKEEYDKVYQINLEYVKSKEGIKADGAEKSVDVSGKMKEIAMERKRQLTEVLSPEQKAKWKSYKQNKMEERKAKGLKEQPMFDDIGGM